MKNLKLLKRVLAMFVTVLIVVTSIQLPAFADDGQPAPTASAPTYVDIPVGGGITQEELNRQLNATDKSFSYYYYNSPIGIGSGWTTISFPYNPSDGSLKLATSNGRNEKGVSVSVRHYFGLEKPDDIKVIQDGNEVNNSGMLYTTSDIKISFRDGSNMNHMNTKILVKNKDADEFQTITFNNGQWTIPEDSLKKNASSFVEDGKLTLSFESINYESATNIEVPVGGKTPSEWASIFDKNLGSSQSGLSRIYDKIRFDLGEEYDSRNKKIELPEGNHFYQFKGRNESSYGEKNLFKVRRFYTLAKENNAEAIDVENATDNKLYTDNENYSGTVDIPNNKTAKLFAGSEEIGLSENGEFTLTQDDLAEAADDNGNVTLNAYFYSGNVTTKFDDSSKKYGKSIELSSGEDKETVKVTPKDGCKVTNIKLITKKNGNEDSSEILNIGSPKISKPVLVEFNNDIESEPNISYEVIATCEVAKTIEVDAIQNKAGYTGNYWAYYLGEGYGSIDNKTDLLVYAEDGTENNISASKDTYLPDGTYYYRIGKKANSWDDEYISITDPSYFYVRHFYKVTTTGSNKNKIELRQDNKKINNDKAYTDIGEGNLNVIVAPQEGRVATLYVAAGSTKKTTVIPKYKEDEIIFTFTKADLAELASNAISSLDFSVSYEETNVIVTPDKNGTISYSKSNDDRKISVSVTPKSGYTVSNIEVFAYETLPKLTSDESQERVSGSELSYENDERWFSSDVEAIATSTFDYVDTKFYKIQATIVKELERNEEELPVVKFVPEVYTRPSDEEILEAIYDKVKSPLLQAAYPVAEEGLLELLAASTTPPTTINVEFAAGRHINGNTIWKPIDFKNTSEGLGNLVGYVQQIHEFGENVAKDKDNTETILITYNNVGDGDQFTTYTEEVKIKLDDLRLETTLKAPNTIAYTYDADTTEGKTRLTDLIEQRINDGGLLTYVDEEGITQTVNRDDIDGKITVIKDHLDASLFTQSVTVNFKGTEDLKPCEQTFKVRVNRQGADIDVNTQVVKFGEVIDPLVTVKPDNNGNPKYAYAIIGLEGDAEGYVSLNLNPESMKIKLPDTTGNGTVDSLVNGFVSFLERLKKEEEEVGFDVAGIHVSLTNKTIDYSEALISALNEVIQRKNLEQLKTLITTLNDRLNDSSISTEALNGFIDFAQEILKQLPEGNDKIHVSVGLIGEDKTPAIPRNAGAYAVVAGLTDRNYQLGVSVGGLVIEPIRDFEMYWCTGEDNEFDITEIKAQPSTPSAGIEEEENGSIEVNKDNWFKVNAYIPGPGKEPIDLTIDNHIVYTFSGVSASGNIGIASQKVPTEAGIYFETATIYGNYSKTITRFVTIKKVETELKLAYVEPGKDPSILNGEIETTYGDEGFTCEEIPYGNRENLCAVVVEKETGNIIEDAEAKLVFYDLKLLGKDYLSEKFPEDADDYLMVAYYKGSDDYRPALDFEQKLTIERRKVKVNVKNASKFYGEEDPEFELELASDYTIATKDMLDNEGNERPLTDVLGINLERLPGENAGVYAVGPTASSLFTFNRNYELEGLAIEDLLSLTGKFTINKKPLTVEFDPNEYEITYLDKPADVQAKVRGVVEGDNVYPVLYYEGTDRYDNHYEGLLPPTNAGDYTVKAYLLGLDTLNYTWEEPEADYIVNPRDIKKVDVRLRDYLVYNGEKQQQHLLYVKDNKNRSYLSSRDYDVVERSTYAKDVRNYNFVIKGTGNYKGWTSAPYEMHAKRMYLAFDKWAYVSTYGEKEPVKVNMFGDVAKDKLRVKLTYKNVATGETYNRAPKDAGYYLVTAELSGRDKNNYTCNPITTSFVVLRKNLENSAYIRLTEKLTYNGRVQDQDFKVFVKGQIKPLVEGKDYKVIYNSDKATDAGKYTLKIMGINNYAGVLAKDFTVSQKEVTVNFKHTPYDDSVYMEHYDKVDTRIKGLCKGDKLDLIYTYIAVDEETHAITYKGTERPTDAGAYIVVASINPEDENAINYRIKGWFGVVSTKYVVNPKSIETADIELEGDALVFGEDNTQPFNATITLKHGEEVYKLVQGKDFDVEYNEKITKPGVYNLILKGKGNFKETASVPFVVLAKDDDEANKAELIKEDGTLKYGNGSIDVYVKGADEDNDFFEAKFDRSAVAAGSGLKAQELSELVREDDPHLLELFFVVTKPEVPKEKTEKLSKQIGNIFDVDFFKRYDRDDSTTKPLSDSGADVRFTIDLTKEMKNPNPDAYRRDYTLITEHEGKLANMRSKYVDEDNTITFKTHLFSKYYVGYVDVPLAVNTGDSNDMALWFILAIMAAGIAGVAGYCLYKRKEEQ